jgi:hypothetical protein
MALTGNSADGWYPSMHNVHGETLHRDFIYIDQRRLFDVAYSLLLPIRRRPLARVAVIFCFDISIACVV